MKNKLISLAVAAAFSGYTSAAEVYSLDGVSVGISGEVEINYYKSQVKGEDLEMKVSEGNFGFDMLYEMTEEFSIQTSLSSESNNTDDGVTRGDVTLAFVYAQAHTLTLGNQSTVFDDAGIGADYEFAFSSYVTVITSNGEQVVRYAYDGGEVFYGGLAYSGYANETASATVSEDDYEVDGKIGARVEDYDFTLFVGTAEHVGLQETAFALEARYVLGDFKFAGTYGSSSSEQASGGDIDKDSIGLAASWWDSGRLEYAAGWAILDDSSESDKINDVYLNVTYTLSDSVKAFSELGITDRDNSDVGFVVGVNAGF